MGDEERETPAATSPDRSDADEKTCTYCEAAIETGDWYPVAKERDSDGSLHLYPFCSDLCRETWFDERKDRDAAG